MEADTGAGLETVGGDITGVATGDEVKLVDGEPEDSDTGAENGTLDVNIVGVVATTGSAAGDWNQTPVTTTVKINANNSHQFSEPIENTSKHDSELSPPKIEGGVTIVT
ncbi:Uncharacterized protein Fot_49213 [Forsythia ovata]|uniref:Uncharacterized protein n=1 Tax=Forsythia ovata TaxID=205694 RepID=A0ABD1QB90_9LAMI